MMMTIKMVMKNHDHSDAVEHSTGFEDENGINNVDIDDNDEEEEEEEEETMIGRVEDMVEDKDGSDDTTDDDDDDAIGYDNVNIVLVSSTGILAGSSATSASLTASWDTFCCFLDSSDRS